MKFTLVENKYASPLVQNWLPILFPQRFLMTYERHEILSANLGTATILDLIRVQWILFPQYWIGTIYPTGDRIHDLIKSLDIVKPMHKAAFFFFK